MKILLDMNIPLKYVALFERKDFVLLREVFFYIGYQIVRYFLLVR
jgi:hypothetical protein